MKSIASIAVVCLLLLAQWTGFFTVLCVAGPDHVEFESAIASCCGPHAPGGGMFDEGRACVGCKDVSVETASAWDPSRRAATNAILAVMDACGPVLAATAGTAAAGARTPAFAHFIAAAPLRC